MSVTFKPARAEGDAGPDGAEPSGRRNRAGGPRRWAVVVAGVAVVLAGAWWVTRSPLFGLRVLTVSGDRHVSEQRIRSLGGLSDRTNVLWLSTSGLERGLESDPWILSARIERSLPGTVTVEIEERSPIAISEPGGWLVARDGTVLGRRHQAVLPVIEPGRALHPGDRLSTARLQVAVARALPRALRLAVRRIVTSGGRVTLELRGGATALLGEPTGLPAKASVLASVLRWAGEHAVPVERVDVRAPAAPALLPASPRPSPGVTP
jgi:cell division protein FtsQ